MIRAELGNWYGLGNQLFMLAAAESFAKQTGMKFYIQNRRTPHNPHSSANYYDSLLKNFLPLAANPEQELIINEPGFNIYTDWLDIIKNHSAHNIVISGYFQNWRYVEAARDTFIERLSFNTDILKKYPDISQCVFVHVRGNDYLNWVGGVDLTQYYEKCLNMVTDKIVVFTDDTEYAKKVLARTCEFIIENEVDSLYLMSKCKGCICANSTFSWWGAYLNPNRQIFIPSKWNEDGVKRYSFPGTTIVDV